VRGLGEVLLFSAFEFLLLLFFALWEGKNKEKEKKMSHKELNLNNFFR